MDLFNACKPIQDSGYPSLCLIVHVPFLSFLPRFPSPGGS